MSSIDNEAHFKENYIGKGEVLSFDLDASVCDFIDEQIKISPEATAVVFEKNHITFQQINDQSNQLANYLLIHGIKRGNAIALCLDASSDIIVIILAILKTGSHYVPLDISYPKDRLNFMLKDSEANTLITTSKYASLLKKSNQKIVLLDKVTNTIKLQSPFFKSLAHANDLAYIIYTSGSTGAPKGVKISHKAINNHMLWMKKEFQFNKQHRILHKTPLSFDPSVWEVFIPLYSGASLVVAPNSSHIDPDAMIALINKYKITTLQLVPSILRLFLMHENIKNCQTLQHVFVGGESLSREIKTLFFEKLNAELINLYGPTEVTIDSTFHKISSSDKDLKINNIGRPIANTSLYVVKKNNTLARFGEEGELYIGSLSLSSGYHQRDALTHESFIENTFEPFRFKKIYKTGDIVRWLPNYSLEFLGRNNDQVKINGARIEPNELVQIILKCTNVSECIVIKKIDSHGHDYLACYLTSKKNMFLNLQTIKNQLKRKFPSYMLPRVYIPLETIPLTVNGKINTNALPEPRFDKSLLISEKINEETYSLLLLWQIVLETNQISLSDNFFEAGGGSLLALKLISLIKEKFEVIIKIRDIYKYPTIKSQMSLIKKIKHLKKQENSLFFPDPIICLHEAGSNTPIFLIHPIGGTIFWFSKLACILDCNRPIYGIQDPSIDLEEMVLNSIEEMALFYLKSIKKIQPEGPYLIGGASFGATVAIEIADLLKKENNYTCTLFILDGWGVYPNTLLDDNYFKTSMLRQHAELLSDFQKYGLPPPEALLKIQWFRLNLLWKYKIKLIECPIALFKSEDILPAFKEIDAPLNHWENFSSHSITPYIVPGNHETMFKEPYVYILRDKINEYLCINSL